MPRQTQRQRRVALANRINDGKPRVDTSVTGGVSCEWCSAAIARGDVMLVYAEGRTIIHADCALPALEFLVVARAAG
jgi:hypothetical protein